jgi:UDPglucose 6-dehydrogenase
MAALAAGLVPIHEPGLDDLIGRHLATGALRFSGDHRAAVESARVVFVAVGTTDQSGAWQTATLRACLTEIVPDIADDAVLVVRSTLPPMTVGQLDVLVTAIRTSVDRPPIPVLLNPEFTREGTALADFLQPDRVVIGVASDPSGHGVGLLRKLYRSVQAPVLVMTAADACLSKLGANLFLATKISFANELAVLCDAYGATIDRVVEAMAHDPRIGGSFLRAGIGFGGSCLPHQVMETAAMAARAGLDTPLVSAVGEINHRQRATLVERVVELLGGTLAGARVALLGLTFKPHTDDIRDAPSLEIAGRLVAGGASVTAFDPMPRARERVAEAIPGLDSVSSVEDALRGADVAALLTEWPEFVELDWMAAGALMRRRLVVDGRNALAPRGMLEAGFTYAGFGRGVLRPNLADQPDGAHAARPAFGLAAVLDGTRLMADS